MYYGHILSYGGDTVKKDITIGTPIGTRNKGRNKEEMDS